MEPASTIIKKFGGDTAVAAITGVHRTRVANWKRWKKAGGSGGAIPFRHVPALLEAAKAKEISLSADDFLPAAETATTAERAA